MKRLVLLFISFIVSGLASSDDLSRESIQEFYSDFFQEFLVRNDQCQKKDQAYYYDVKDNVCKECQGDTDGIGWSFLCSKHYTDVKYMNQHEFWEDFFANTTKCWAKPDSREFYDAELEECRSCDDSNEPFNDFFCKNHALKQEYEAKLKTNKAIATSLLVIVICLAAGLVAVAYKFQDKMDEFKKFEKRSPTSTTNKEEEKPLRKNQAETSMESEQKVSISHSEKLT